jgi:UDP-N-acetylglucosamine 2-epimerase (non-hydrolysing)
MHVAIVQGTRPEIIKNYSIVKALRDAGITFDVLHTNQHRARRMCGDIYAQMQYAPDYSMEGVYSIGRAIEWLQQAFRRLGVSHVIVNGDTAASIAGALAAVYMDIDVSHIEAGLRSRDVQMLEERNRIMVDALAQHLFAYTEIERELLLQTPDVRGVVHLEGNTTVDVLEAFADCYAERPIDGEYLFVTMHRKEFTDVRSRMLAVFGALESLGAGTLRVVFSIHPRTRDVAARNGIRLDDYGSVEFVEPMPIFESLAHQKHAAAVLTDSGCIQEEAYLLGVPCITARENTERHLTIVHGANVLTGFEPSAIRVAVERALEAPRRAWPEIFGRPGVGGRIVERIAGSSVAARVPARVSVAAR